MAMDHEREVGAPAGDKGAGRVDRVFRLTSALRAEEGVATAERLAASLGVSVRTIYRDIESLSSRLADQPRVRGLAGSGRWSRMVAVM